MRAALAKPLDWCSIQLARLSVHRGVGAVGQVAQVESLLEDPDFFGDSVVAPHDLRFTTKRAFQFTSSVVSPSKRNNTVHGRLFTTGKRWQDKPVVILLHGWNMQAGYHVLFPHLARRLVKQGVNVAMFALPYHTRRKPRGKKAIHNFLSGDLVHVVQAAHQSLADARALIAWLEEQGCPRIGLWGISLGAWLSGLLTCEDARIDCAVLMSPVSRMDRVIAELDFCAPIRRSLGGARVRLDRLNLTNHQPKVAHNNILLIGSEHDLFAPIGTVEDLHRAWSGTELWRPRHGHISVLMSMPVMERTVGWIAQKMQGEN
ncbi:MAG TPA: alpha/beta fold hydrolase [Verrucomicrobiae bacterium]|nr:alpha/beta fold hydrolase [Verrucomicrobiae bacterium]